MTMALGWVAITFFQQTDRGTNHYFFFWGADSESKLKKAISKKKIAGTCDLKFFENAYKVETSKSENHIKWGPIVGI